MMMINYFITMFFNIFILVPCMAYLLILFKKRNIEGGK